MTPRKRRPKGSGTVRQLPSRRWQARYRLPDGTMEPAPVTFDTKLLACRPAQPRTTRRSAPAAAVRLSRARSQPRPLGWLDSSATT